MDFGAKYDIAITDITGFTQIVRDSDVDRWETIRVAVARGEGMRLTFSNAADGLPIQLQWAPGQIVRAELIPVK